MKERARAHYLRHNARCEMPTHIIVLDTEAWIDKIPLDEGEKYPRIRQSLRLGWLCHMRYNHIGSWDMGMKEFHSIDEFEEMLFEELLGHMRKCHVIIVAHNMAYDYAILGLDTLLSRNNYDIHMRAVDSIFLIKARNEYLQNSVSLISSTNIYQMSLEKLGKAYDFPKAYSPEFDDFESERHINKLPDSEVSSYCKRDVEVLCKVMKEDIEFMDRNDLGDYKLTGAGQAFNAFRHRFMHHKILVHPYREILDLELESYRGGRCEAFFIGKAEGIYKLDINSMYPSVMHDEGFPIKPLSKEPIKDMAVNDLRNVGNDIFMLANCDIILREPAIACKRDKLLFPVGRIRQTLCDNEIRLLLNEPDIGEIIKVNSIVGYQKEPIFREYVKFFYDIRKNSTNEAERIKCKLLMNGLYGRFGKRANMDIELCTNENLAKQIKEVMVQNRTYVIDATEKGGKNFILLGDNIYMTKASSADLDIDSCPIIASAVTAYARGKLYGMAKRAGLDNVLYCDTDSLFVNENGYLSLQQAGFVDEKSLGLLKMEGFGKVTIYGPKNYVFNEECKQKGVKKNAVLVRPNTYLQYHFETKAKRYRKGNNDGEVMLTPIEKTISQTYDKGIVTPSGKVRPLEFREF